MKDTFKCCGGKKSPDATPQDDKNVDGEMEVETGSSTGDHRGNWSRQLDFFLACVGYAVGIGNLWRFPYLCMRNGGGAFLIPYFVALALCGIPLFFMELAIGQFSSQSPVLVWNLCPLFKGLGWGMVLVSGIVCIYYNIVITWVLYYLFKSFTLSVPWAECGKWWNTPLCLDRTAETSNQTANSVNETIATYTSFTFNNLTNTSEIKWKTPAEEFWQHEMLELTSGIDELGGIKWQLLIFLIVSWIIVFLCLCKGVKSTGKVVYVTATVPYIFLTILLIRGLLLPGSARGIHYYLVPEWKKLFSFKVWAEACLQIFYSLGPAWGGLITMSSYSKFHNNCLRDSIMIPIINCGTSFYGGFVIFSVIGFMAHQAGLPVEKVITSGPGLAFIAYPEAISKMPISPLWAICFFTMMLTLGLDSQFGMFETMTSSFIDEFPKYLRKHKVLFTFILCVVECIIGLPFVTRGGMYIFQIFDWYVGSVAVMSISIMECVAIGWVYNYSRLYEDIEMMIGHKPSIIWAICWCGVTPTILLVMTVYNLFAMGVPYYGDYNYPHWAIVMGWVIAFVPLIPLPICFLLEILKQEGTFLERLRAAMKPSPDWGPRLPQHRAAYKYTSGPIIQTDVIRPLTSTEKEQKL